jgi:predicted transcriptional regulator
MKINKTLGYAISWLATNGKSSADIATELDLTEKQIDNYLEKNSTNISDKKLPIKTRPVKSADLMIKHTRDKGINSVSIMTKEASSMNDDFKKKASSAFSKRHEDCIFRPKKKK